MTHAQQHVLGMVWAQSADARIGVDGALPWHLPEDLAHFKAVTAGHPVIMGHATWLSLPPRFRPLPGRENLVLSRRAGLVLEGAHVVAGVAQALAAVAGREAWVVGGGQVYAAFMPWATRLEVTHVDVVVGRGTPAPAVDASWVETDRTPEQGWSASATGPGYRFVTLVRALPATEPTRGTPALVQDAER